jgi:hypothetical protein
VVRRHVDCLPKKQLVHAGRAMSKNWQRKFAAAAASVIFGSATIGGCATPAPRSESCRIDREFSRLLVQSELDAAVHVAAQSPDPATSVPAAAIAFWLGDVLPKTPAGPRSDFRGSEALRDAQDSLAVCADRGDAGAQLGLGVILVTYSDSAIEVDLAEKYFRKAAAQGVLAAFLGLAAIEDRRGNTAVALSTLEELRKRHSFFSDEMIGVLAHKSNIFSRKSWIAVPFLRRAGEEQSSAISQRLLAEIYEQGVRVERDDAESRKWQDRYLANPTIPGEIPAEEAAKKNQ